MLYTTDKMLEPTAKADKEENLADILASALRRIEVLESKLTTYQGLDVLAVEIEKRLVARLRNTYPDKL